MAAFLSFNKIGKKVNDSNLLADLSFGVQKGELLFVLGKANSGKSTLFKILILEEMKFYLILDMFLKKIFLIPI